MRQRWDSNPMQTTDWELLGYYLTATLPRIELPEIRFLVKLQNKSIMLYTQIDRQIYRYTVEYAIDNERCTQLCGGILLQFKFGQKVSLRMPEPGGHSTLEVKKVLRQQLKTRGLIGLMRDFFSGKGDHSVRRPTKKGGQTV